MYTIRIKGLVKDGYKLPSKCGLWSDFHIKITQTKILMIALVETSFRILHFPECDVIMVDCVFCLWWIPLETVGILVFSILLRRSYCLDKEYASSAVREQCPHAIEA